MYPLKISLLIYISITDSVSFHDIRRTNNARNEEISVDLWPDIAHTNAAWKSLWNLYVHPCAVSVRGLSRKNSDNKRKITHGLERLLHRGPCHVCVTRRPLYFSRRVGPFRCRSSRRDKNAKRGARYRKSICMWNDTCTPEVSSVNYNEWTKPCVRIETSTRANEKSFPTRFLRYISIGRDGSLFRREGEEIFVYIIMYGYRLSRTFCFFF